MLTYSYAENNSKIWGEKKNMCTQCAEEKSNESVEDMDGTFAGW